MKIIENPVVKVTVKKKGRAYLYTAHRKNGDFNLIRSSNKSEVFALAHHYPHDRPGSAGDKDRAGNQFTFSNANGKPQRQCVNYTKFGKYIYADYEGVKTFAIEREHDVNDFVSHTKE